MPQLDELDTASGLVLRQQANRVVFNTITTDYTLVASDWGKWIEANSGSAIEITVPPTSSVAFGQGIAIPIVRYGSGTVEVVPGSGVTINSDGEDNLIPSQYKTVLLIHRGSNVWYLQGIGATGSSSGGGGLTQLSTPTLTMTAASDDAIDFSWTNVANESSYTVQIAEDSGFITGVQTATPAADDTAHQFTGLDASTLYYGRVKAEGDGVTYSDSAYGTDSETTDSSSSTVQNWDSVTPPAIPAGWTASSNLVTIASGGAVSAPNVLTTNDTGYGNLVNTTIQAADTSISIFFGAFDDGAEFLPYIRATTTTPFAGGGTCYLADITSTDGAVKLFKKVAGTNTQLGSTITPPLAQGTGYTVKLAASGTTISVQIIRYSDSYYLNSSGTFVNSVQTAISVTDSAIASGGYSGIFMGGLSGEANMFIDDTEIL